MRIRHILITCFAVFALTVAAGHLAPGSAHETDWWGVETHTGEPPHPGCPDDGVPGGTFIYGCTSVQAACDSFAAWQKAHFWPLTVLTGIEFTGMSSHIVSYDCIMERSPGCTVMGSGLTFQH